MNSENPKDFEHNINHLISLLRKIIRNIPQAKGPFSKMQDSGKDASMNINFCFFTFLPLPPDDWDEIEDIYDQYLAQEENSEDLSLDLNNADMEFLRRNGIKF